MDFTEISELSSICPRCNSLAATDKYQSSRQKRGNGRRDKSGSSGHLGKLADFDSSFVVPRCDKLRRALRRDEYDCDGDSCLSFDSSMCDLSKSSDLPTPSESELSGDESFDVCHLLKTVMERGSKWAPGDRPTETSIGCDFAKDPKSRLITQSTCYSSTAVEECQRSPAADPNNSTCNVASAANAKMNQIKSSMKSTISSDDNTACATFKRCEAPLSPGPKLHITENHETDKEAKSHTLPIVEVSIQLPNNVTLKEMTTPEMSVGDLLEKVVKREQSKYNLLAPHFYEWRFVGLADGGASQGPLNAATLVSSIDVSNVGLTLRVRAAFLPQKGQVQQLSSTLVVNRQGVSLKPNKTEPAGDSAASPLWSFDSACGSCYVNSPQRPSMSKRNGPTRSVSFSETPQVMSYCASTQNSFIYNSYYEDDASLRADVQSTGSPASPSITGNEYTSKGVTKISQAPLAESFPCCSAPYPSIMQEQLMRDETTTSSLVLLDPNTSKQGLKPVPSLPKLRGQGAAERDRCFCIYSREIAEIHRSSKGNDEELKMVLEAKGGLETIVISEDCYLFELISLLAKDCSHLVDRQEIHKITFETLHTCQVLDVTTKVKDISESSLVITKQHQREFPRRKKMQKSVRPDLNTFFITDQSAMMPMRYFCHVALQKQGNKEYKHCSVVIDGMSVYHSRFVKESLPVRDLDEFLPSADDELRQHKTPIGDSNYLDTGKGSRVSLALSDSSSSSSNSKNRKSVALSRLSFFSSSRTSSSEDSGLEWEPDVLNCRAATPRDIIHRDISTNKTQSFLDKKPITSQIQPSEFMVPARTSYASLRQLTSCRNLPPRFAVPAFQVAAETSKKVKPSTLVDTNRHLNPESVHSKTSFQRIPSLLNILCKGIKSATPSSMSNQGELNSQYKRCPDNLATPDTCTAGSSGSDKFTSRILHTSDSALASRTTTASAATNESDKLGLVLPLEFPITSLLSVEMHSTKQRTLRIVYSTKRHTYHRLAMFASDQVTLIYKADKPKTCSEIAAKLRRLAEIMRRSGSGS